MEKKKKPDWTEIAGVVWKALLLTLVLFILGVLALSALIYRGVAAVEMIPFLLYVVCGVAAFGATAFLSVFSRILKMFYPTFSRIFKMFSSLQPSSNSIHNDVPYRGTQYPQPFGLISFRISA